MIPTISSPNDIDFVKVVERFAEQGTYYIAIKIEDKYLFIPFFGVDGCPGRESANPCRCLGIY